MKKFDVRIQIVFLNELKSSFQIFTRDELLSEFRRVGIPCNQIFWSVFRNSGLIIEVLSNTYKFTNPGKPIYFRILDRIYQKYREKIEIYQHNSELKKKEIACINFLLNRGYKIYLP